MSKREAKMVLYSDSARGIYIPRHFAESIARECLSGVDPADLDYLARGPNDIEAGEDSDNPEPHNAEAYWDTWQDVCDHAVITDSSDGTVYNMYQDGDLWLVEQGALFADSPSDAPGIDTQWYIDDGEEEETV
jgi:hypothetical protein